MKAIIAVNNLGYVGLNGSLPWRSSEDLKHFKSLTSGATLVVGWVTSQKLPPLKGRELLIDPMPSDEYLDTVDTWCIGGKYTYEKYAKYFTELHVSHIDDNTIGDTMFPDFKNLNPECKIYNYYYKTNTIK